MLFRSLTLNLNPSPSPPPPPPPSALAEGRAWRRPRPATPQTSFGSGRRAAGPRTNGRLRTPREGDLRTSAAPSPALVPGVQGRAFPGYGGVCRLHRAMLRIRGKGERDSPSRIPGAQPGWGAGAVRPGRAPTRVAAGREDATRGSTEGSKR